MGTLFREQSEITDIAFVVTQREAVDTLKCRRVFQACFFLACRDYKTVFIVGQCHIAIHVIDLGLGQSHLLEQPQVLLTLYAHAALVTAQGNQAAQAAMDDGLVARG